MFLFKSNKLNERSEREGFEFKMDGMSKNETIHEVIHDDDHHPSIDRIVAIALDSSESSDGALKWGN